MSDGVPLREYVDRIFAEREKAREAQLSAMRRAVDSASVQLNERLESMNQFRSQISEERLLYVRHDTLDAKLKPINDRLTALERVQSVGAGSLATLNWLWAAAGAVATTLIAFALRWYGK